ncbi:MAG: hypothetical protein P8076_01800 [Gammaproteobacteria bacterium]
MIRSLAALALIGCVACTPVRSVPAISGTAHGGGLLVIGCRVWIRGDLDQRTRAHVDQGVLLGSGGAADTYSGQVIDGLLVFADLPPGRYRLALINASYHKGTTVAQDVFLVPPAMTDRLTFHVGAGKATYGGRLQIIGRLAGGADGGAFTLKQDRRLELQAWRKLLARYPHGSWAGTIRARVRTLQSAGH